MAEHTERMRVGWIDTDAGGRIHFTVAFRWAEAAETGLYRKLGLLSDRTIVLDWGLAGTGPCELDFAWYLFVNGWRIDATREQLLEDFRHVAAELHDPRALELAWLAQLCWHGPLLAHELVEASDEKRERARAELAWWVERVRGALELL